MEIIKLQRINAFKTVDHAFLHLLGCRAQILKALATKGKRHINTISVRGWIISGGDSTSKPPYGGHRHRTLKQ